jgi:hypothetical protein
MNPVLHSTTHSAGATEVARRDAPGAEEDIPMTVGRRRFGTVPTYE